MNQEEVGDVSQGAITIVDPPHPRRVDTETTEQNVNIDEEKPEFPSSAELAATAWDASDMKKKQVNSLYTMNTYVLSLM